MEEEEEQQEWEFEALLGVQERLRSVRGGCLAVVTPCVDLA